jgi:hypothetical protein
LAFLKSRLQRECVTDPQQMRVNEQRWLDYVPSYFPCHVSRDPGINAAYWNLHERPLSNAQGTIFAGDAPLRAFHFSGYDPANPNEISKYAPQRPRVLLSEEPILSSLCEEFRSALSAAGLERHRGIPFPFDTLPGGVPVDATLRAVYRAAVIDAEASTRALPPDGYDLAQRPQLLAWVAATYGAARIELPEWARSASPTPAPSGASQAWPSAPRTAANPRAEVSTPPMPNTEELVLNLARSSSAAFSNLNQRLSELERRMAQLAPVQLGS